jgi:hypothetical protein
VASSWNLNPTVNEGLTTDFEQDILDLSAIWNWQLDFYLQGNSTITPKCNI